MATGDVIVFDEAKLALLNGTHDLDTHVIKAAICDNTTIPVAGTATPALGDFTQVGSAGTYVVGGATLTISLTEVAGTVTYDFTNNPVWLQDASNDIDAYWAIIYNDTEAGDAAIGFMELGGPIDMSAGDLTLTWNVNGFFTLA